MVTEENRCVDFGIGIVVLDEDNNKVAGFGEYVWRDKKDKELIENNDYILSTIKQLLANTCGCKFKEELKDLINGGTD